MSDNDRKAMLLQLLLDSETSTGTSRSTSSSDRSDDEETDILVPLVALILQRRHSRHRRLGSPYEPYGNDRERRSHHARVPVPVVPVSTSNSVDESDQSSSSASSDQANFDLPSARFQNKYKITASTFRLLCDQMQLTKYVWPTDHVDHWPKHEEHLLVALSFYTSQKPLTTIALEHRVTESSASSSISLITDWLVSVKDEYIVWPTTELPKRMSAGFVRSKRLPRVIGAIGGLRIPIRYDSDHVEPRDHVIIIQATVDGRGSFTDIHCGAPGVAHDATVLYSSDLYERACGPSSEAVFPAGAVILCDTSYPRFSWLLPPFLDDGCLDEQQSRFNDVHIRTRLVVLRAFERLKLRFLRLDFVRYAELGTLSDLVTACCVLHNVCTLNDDNTELLTRQETTSETV